jgi:metallophosphoesterase (TIGR03767 family)
VPSTPDYLLRQDLGGHLPTAHGIPLLNLLHLSDAHVIDTVSPARCEWVQLLAHEPRWQPLLPMHRPYEALTHWALAAHVQALHQHPLAPLTQKPYALALSTGDNIDNAQMNELQSFLTILAGGDTCLSAVGGVHEPAPARGAAPWPFWCPEPGVADLWKALGCPEVPDFVQRCSAPLHSPGLGFAWTSVPGNHDLLRQGTALTHPALEAIALGQAKALQRPSGFDPADPLAFFVDHPTGFSSGDDRRVKADAGRYTLTRQTWLDSHCQHGAAGYALDQLAQRGLDSVIDTEHVRLILLDTNHPAGDFQGSIGAQQLAWLEARLAEVDAQPGRLAVLVSHHGSASLTNTKGDDPERLHAEALTAVAHRHACVVAWLVGHRHLHHIAPHPGPLGGFWEITTASLIDWPSQVRAVEILRHADGQIEIVCTLLDHGAAADSLAGLHRQLAGHFAGAMATQMQGRPEDGHVRLLLPSI